MVEFNQGDIVEVTSNCPHKTLVGRRYLVDQKIDDSYAIRGVLSDYILPPNHLRLAPPYNVGDQVTVLFHPWDRLRDINGEVHDAAQFMDANKLMRGTIVRRGNGVGWIVEIDNFCFTFHTNLLVPDLEVIDG